MNKNWVKRQRAEQRELEQLRKKNRESVKEIQRLHQKVRDVREASEKALEDVTCLLYTSPSPRDYAASRMPSSA